MKTAIYQPRWYRSQCVQSGLTQFIVRYKESDLCIRADTDLSAIACTTLIQTRQELEFYINNRHPEFAHSLSPLLIRDDAPVIAKKMASAAHIAGVGPMAAVAGAINCALAVRLQFLTSTLIIENGGDIYARGPEPIVIALHAGASPLSMHLAVNIDANRGVGVCTSSGTVGHSLSFGNADAVTVISHDCILADAMATAIGNMVNSRDDFDAAIEFAKSIEDIAGILIVKDDQIATWGKGFEICVV